MDRNMTEILIRQLQMHPCLYSWKSSAYKDKSKRSWALKMICAELRKIDPTVTEDRVETKVKSLRSQYTREIRYQRKKKSKGELDFKPKLWCFRELSFLKDHTDTKKNFSEDGVQKYTMADDEYTCYEEPEQKFAAQQSYNDEDVIEENELYESDFNGSVQNHHQIDGTFEDIIEEDTGCDQNYPKINMRVKGDEDANEKLNNAQITFFQNQEIRAKQKHFWEKKHAAEKHNWIIKIYEAKHKILQSELALKMNELNKKANN